MHAVPLAEFAVAALFSFAKGFPQLREWQQQHRWTRYTSQNLAGQRVLVVGLGAVGRATAAVAIVLAVLSTILISRGLCGRAVPPAVGGRARRP